MNVRAIVLMMLLDGTLAGAAAAADYRALPLYQSVATAHVIRVEGEGVVEVAYPTAQALFEKDDILDAVQEAYAALLPEGERPEFEVVSGGDRTWSYVNRHGERSRVVELHRDIRPEERAFLVYFTEGERFFGSFRAVIEITVTPTDAASSRYDVRVLAYPERSVSRFFARHLGIAERFFRSKTREVTDLTVTICRFLMPAG